MEEFEIIDGKLDFGTVSLAENSTTLDEVTVRAERSQTEFKLGSSYLSRQDILAAFSGLGVTTFENNNSTTLPLTLWPGQLESPIP